MLRSLFVGLIPAVRLQANQPEYHHINMDLSLSSQLARKIIIEYPEFIVLLPSEVSEYQPEAASKQGVVAFEPSKKSEILSMHPPATVPAAAVA